MNRRKFLTGFAGLLAAPAIVRVSSLMPVRCLSEIGTHDLAVGDMICFKGASTDLLPVRWVVTDVYTSSPFWDLPASEAAYAS